MASRGGKVVLVGSLGLFAAMTMALVVPLASTARASACSHFGTTAAQKLSHKQARRAMGCLVNRARHRHGLRRVRSNGRLKRAAERHTAYMKRHHCFSHRCPGEPSFLSRLRRVNYVVGGLRRWKVGENIAWAGGRKGGTPKAIVRGWMRSPGHRANILDRHYRQVGVGFASGRIHGKRSGVMFTTDFGMRRR
jgi:uncharacterized protein YkwD